MSDGRITLMGTPLELTSYERWITRVQELAGEQGCHAVDFSNTHILSLRRHDAHFARLTRSIDYFVPDGMPLVWVLNWAGAQLGDRVYGPEFMRRCTRSTPAPRRHFLIGGSPEVGEALREALAPAQFVGSYHGLVGEDGRVLDEDEGEFFTRLGALDPDFIWVGLGAPKQYAFIARAKERLSRGVLLSVGFAFEVNAGTKADAPAFLQRAGLTWLFRLASEPRRLATRYLKYNSLFIGYLAADWLRGRLFEEKVRAED